MLTSLIIKVMKIKTALRLVLTAVNGEMWICSAQWETGFKNKDMKQKVRRMGSQGRKKRNQGEKSGTLTPQVA